MKIRDIHISTDSIFALTDFGILAANKSASYLSDYNNWNSINVPFPFSIEHLESVNENFIAYGNQNTLWSYTGSWKVILDNPNQQVRKVRHINDQLVVSTSSYATVYESNLNTLEDTVLLFYALNGVTGIVPNDFYITDDFYWLADETKGFSRVRNNFNAEIISNSGPFTNEAFHLSCNHGKLYIAAGRVDGSNWNKTFNWHGVFINIKMIGPCTIKLLIRIWRQILIQYQIFCGLRHIPLTRMNFMPLHMVVGSCILKRM